MSAEDQGQAPDTPSTAAQVAAESAKRAAKKTAQKRAAKKAAAPRGSTAGKTKVRMTTSSRGVKVGAQRTLPTADAERLIRQGHAVKA